MIYYKWIGACNSAGRVPEWHSGSRVFDPRQVHQIGIDEHNAHLNLPNTSVIVSTVNGVFMLSFVLK